jgi:hypothetical protein
VAAGDPRLDPVVDRDRVESLGAGAVVVPGGRERRRAQVGAHRAVDRVEVGVGVGLGVVAAEHAIGLVGAGRLDREQIVDHEAEARGEIEDGGVPGVDQLAAPLGLLTGRPVAGAVGEHAAAGAIAGLVDRGVDARVGQAQRAGQAGDAGADDRDRRLAAGRAGDPGGRGQAERRAAADQEIASRRARRGGGAFASAVSGLGDRLAGATSQDDVAPAGTERCEQGCAGHGLKGSGVGA